MYSGIVVKIDKIYEHDNSDFLAIAKIFNEDVIVSKDLDLDKLYIYFASDGVLSEEFCKDNKLLREDGGYVNDNRRIKVISIRGKRSEGLILPLDSLSKYCNIEDFSVGDKIDTVNGVEICKKYIPASKSNKAQGKTKQKKKNKYPFFSQHVDTNQLRFNMNVFEFGDDVIITEKLHGTSGRSANTIKESKNSSFLNKILRRPSKTNREWTTIAGTRRVNLTNDKIVDDNSFYGSNDFRINIHQEFSDRLEKGEEIYYEIVGYLENGTKIMPSCGNDKLGKDFKKRWGSETTFKYDCELGKCDMYVYRMTITNEDGFVVEYPWDLVKIRCEQMGLKYVPELDRFKFTSTQDLIDRVKNLEVGASVLDGSHIKEGVCVRINNSQYFKVFKQKSMDFKILEGIVKDLSTEPDLEEFEEQFI